MAELVAYALMWSFSYASHWSGHNSSSSIAVDRACFFFSSRHSLSSCEASNIYTSTYQFGNTYWYNHICTWLYRKCNNTEQEPEVRKSVACPCHRAKWVNLQRLCVMLSNAAMMMSGISGTSEDVQCSCHAWWVVESWCIQEFMLQHRAMRCSVL